VRADGGAVRLTERVGEYRVTVFTAPTPLCVGPVDISVLVQDANTSATAPELPITIRLAQGEREIVASATRAAATNKLFQAAQVEVPAAGIWSCEVRIAEHEPVRFDLEVVEPAARWTEMWFWLTLPAFIIGLFVVVQSTRPQRLRGTMNP
jgi:hypothetical protein